MHEKVAPIMHESGRVAMPFAGALLVCPGRAGKLETAETRYLERRMQHVHPGDEPEEIDLQAAHPAAGNTGIAAGRKLELVVLAVPEPGQERGLAAGYVVAADRIGRQHGVQLRHLAQHMGDEGI